MRSAAQIVAYEIAMGFALVGVLMVSGSLNLGTIVAASTAVPLAWNWFWLLPLTAVYFISGLAETNRAPFDVAEGESEIVAGFHVEYSGIAFALFFLAEYANMILISALTSVFFFGGWLSPLDGYLPKGNGITDFLMAPSFFWLGAKIFVFLYSVPVAAGDLPALSLRSDHAPRLEGADSHHARMDRGRGRHVLLPRRSLGR